MNELNIPLNTEMGHFLKGALGKPWELHVPCRDSFVRKLSEYEAEMIDATIRYMRSLNGRI